MKPEMEEFLQAYPIGCKVLIKRIHRGRDPAWFQTVVVDHKGGNGTVRIKCKEELKLNGDFYYILFGRRSEITRACEAEGCWEPAVILLEGLYYCSGHLPGGKT